MPLLSFLRSVCAPYWKFLDLFLIFATYCFAPNSSLYRCNRWYRCWVLSICYEPLATIRTTSDQETMSWNTGHLFLEATTKFATDRGVNIPIRDVWRHGKIVWNSHWSRVSVINTLYVLAVHVEFKDYCTAFGNKSPTGWYFAFMKQKCMWPGQRYMCPQLLVRVPLCCMC